MKRKVRFISLGALRQRERVVSKESGQPVTFGRSKQPVL